LTTHEEREHAT